MLIFSAFFILVGLGSALPSYELEKEWNQFQLDYNRNYKSPIELRYRKDIFNKNLESIRKHNEEYEAGLHSYMQGVNQFTDLTFEELHEKLLTYKENIASELESVSSMDLDILEVSDDEVPESIDFREKGYVTPVKNQRSCGSCWAFSAVGSIEGQLYRASEKLVSLSVQELVDCSKSNGGCQGGWMQRAFADLKKLGGITTERSYPYKAKKNNCTFMKDMVVAEVTGSKTIPRNESALQKAVATIGPISVAIEATRKFANYKKGIFYDESCSRKKGSVNHAVLVVGYGKDNSTGLDYWIVKNSWGTSWGDKGYIKMSRNRENNCQIAAAGIYPFVKPKRNYSYLADD
ncbi:unnamed protein product [Hermetia illucens]|uniref:cathepsin L n=1 Tax=Hermetia illucens TaxID=343691 RepID=A0A7R8UWV4_HERIL|nr:unnamed protein product [Hermetia illucens]